MNKSHTLPAQQHPGLNRRRLLRGLGACLSLPAFESLLPATATSTAKAAGPTGAPLRMAFVYFPNGAHQENWWPKGRGKDFLLGRTMQPLEPSFRTSRRQFL